jgi:hypothetical protein
MLKGTPDGTLGGTSMENYTAGAARTVTVTVALPVSPPAAAAAPARHDLPFGQRAVSARSMVEGPRSKMIGMHQCPPLDSPSPLLQTAAQE